MTTTTTSAALVPAGPVFSEPERHALAGFLAGYSGLTREAYAVDLRQFAAWCARHQRQLFGVRRADIECLGRDLEAARRPGDGSSPVARSRSAATGSDTSHDEGSICVPNVPSVR